MKISAAADIFAVPFWVIAAYYFYKIEKKTTYEIILYICCIAGFLIDSFFAIVTLNGRSV